MSYACNCHLYIYHALDPKNHRCFVTLGGSITTYFHRFLSLIAAARCALCTFMCFAVTGILTVKSLFMIATRQLGTSLPVELAHVLPDHGAGDAVDERVYGGVTTNTRLKSGEIGTPMSYNQKGAQHTMKATVIMNSSNTFLLAVVCVAVGLLVRTTEAAVVTVEVPAVVTHSVR